MSHCSVRIIVISYSYLKKQQVQERLNFLSLLLTDTNVTVNKSHVDDLWDDFMIGATSKAEKILILKWFQDALPGDISKYNLLFFDYEVAVSS